MFGEPVQEPRSQEQNRERFGHNRSLLTVLYVSPRNAECGSPAMMAGSAYGECALVVDLNGSVLKQARRADGAHWVAEDQDPPDAAFPVAKAVLDKRAPPWA